MKLLKMWNNMDICFQWISWVFKLSLVSRHRSVSGSVHVLVWRLTSVKTRDFNRATTPATHLAISIYWVISSFYPPFPHLYHMFPIHSFVSQQCAYIKRRRQCNLAHLCSICTSSSLLLFLYGSLELSVCDQQSRSYSRYCFQFCTQHLGPDWDLDSSRRLSNPCCAL